MTETHVDTSSILRGLRRLADSLKQMDDHKSVVPGHYKELSPDITQSYDLMTQGASLIHATSTKYTLMGKISKDEAAKIAEELLKGCQLIATGALVIGTDNYGCCRSTRIYTKRASRAVLATVIQLVEAFVNDPTGHITEKDDNLGAQKCGAVWQTCDAFLKKTVPQGNRNAMRRDLFTWVMDCNETIEEFQEMIDRGPLTSSAQTTDNKTFEQFCEVDDDEQYTAKELELAKACIALVKCSRGAINVTLKASECVGGVAENSSDKNQKELLLKWVGKAHDLARQVGDGVTDLGTLLYPALSLDNIQWQADKQVESILEVINFILDASIESGDGIEMVEEAIEMASKLKTATQTRQKEIKEAVAAASDNL